jgi:hypothetical protein
LSRGGGYIGASADGSPEYKVGGVTIDWTTVPANNADTTLDDGNVIKSGTKYIPFGCILAKITASGLYGPYDAGASDGRETLTRGACYILNETVASDDGDADNPGAVFEGGRIFSDRVKKIDTGAYVAVWSSTVWNAFPRLLVADGD